MQSPKETESLIQEIERLATQSELLEPSREEFSTWVQDALKYSLHFFESTHNGPAWQPYSSDIHYYEKAFSIEDSPGALNGLLETVDKFIDRDGLNPASGGHLGYIPGGGIPSAAIGDFLAAISNRYAGIAFAGPGAVALENFLIRWISNLFKFPETGGGTLTSGGSIANLIAITTARDASGLKPSEWERAVIYGSSHMHHCLHKALRIAGLGHSILREVPLDDQHRIRPADLEKIIVLDRRNGLLPILIIGSAGTTDTGTIDPLASLADIAAKEKLWFHIDAAYGGFFYLLPEMQPLLKGIERADSLVVDPHKGLFLPYGTGAVIVKNVRLLADSQYYQATYMQDAVVESMGFSPADLSPELTRHFRGLRMYFGLKLGGLNAFKACLKEKVLLCAYFHAEIKKRGFETGPTPLLSVTYFRYNSGMTEPNLLNDWLIKAIHADGRIFLSSTTIDGNIWIRLAVLSFRTKMHHIQKVLDMLEEIIPKLKNHFNLS